MATSWTCADAHVHETNGGIDSRSAQGLGHECLTSGDRITGVTYKTGGTAAQVLREWTASTRVEAAAV